MGSVVKPHNIKFLKIRAAFLTLLPVKTIIKLRDTFCDILLRKRQTIIFSNPFLTNNDTTHTMFVDRAVQ